MQVSTSTETTVNVTLTEDEICQLIADACRKNTNLDAILNGATVLADDVKILVSSSGLVRGAAITIKVHS